MYSSGRGRRRHRRNQNMAHHPQPHLVLNDDHLTQHMLDQRNTQSTLENSPSPSTPGPSTSSHRNNRRRVPFRGFRGGKSQFVNKLEEEVGEGEVECSSSSLQIDSDSVQVKGKESGSLCDSESGFDTGANNGETEGCRVDSEGGKETGEELDSGNEDESIKGLEGLTLSVKEPELEEKLLAINQQLQEDELLALESIYGENLILLENQSGLKCFQVHIHVEVLHGLAITTKFNSSGFAEKGKEDISDFSYSFQVEHLPPIVLTCLLPKSYPSKCAPQFTIHVQWLEHTKISRLCRELDSIWAENTGQEVIYQWVEWLHDCTLSYLGFDGGILLGHGDDGQEDTRAISGCVSPDIDIRILKSYNDEQRYKSFCRNIQECSICLSEFAGSEFIKLPCQHFFCEKCLKSFATINVTDGTVFKIKCPEAKCDGTMPPGLIGRLLGDEMFERWESLMLEKTLESMKDVVYCPRCETACLEDGEDHHAQCSKCYYSFCTLCRDKRHVGVECMTPEIKLKILAKRQKSNSMGAEQRRNEQAMINDLLSLKEIFTIAKRCPNCNLAIERSEGCNKMVCHNCGQYFCYRCTKAISGYEHFRDGKCELFAEEEITRWNERMNMQPVAAQMAAMHANAAHPCPCCGQNNVKIGNNNHVRCWACNNHYCYLCRKKVRRSSEHFGPKGCRQHTQILNL